MPPCCLYCGGPLPLLITAAVFAADAAAVTGIAVVAAAEAAAATACAAAVAAARLVTPDTLRVGGRNQQTTCHQGNAAMAHAYRDSVVIQQEGNENSTSLILHTF